MKSAVGERPIAEAPGPDRCRSGSRMKCGNGAFCRGGCGAPDVAYRFGGFFSRAPPP